MSGLFIVSFDDGSTFSRLVGGGLPRRLVAKPVCESGKYTEERAVADADFHFGEGENTFVERGFKAGTEVNAEMIVPGRIGSRDFPGGIGKMSVKKIESADKVASNALIRPEEVMNVEGELPAGGPGRIVQKIIESAGRPPKCVRGVGSTKENAGAFDVYVIAQAAPEGILGQQGGSKKEKC